MIASTGARKPTTNSQRQLRCCSIAPAAYPPKTIPIRKPEYMIDTYFPLPFKGEYSLVSVIAQGTAPPMPKPVNMRMGIRL